jgi:hypothetical protein
MALDNTTDVDPNRNAHPHSMEEVRDELQQAIHDSHEIIVSADTVFPFTLFRDTVTIDRAKLTIIQRSFFNVAKVMSIRIEDILNVTANVGPLFGSLHIVSRVLNSDKPFDINFLWRADALKMKRIMQGHIIAMQKEIDVSSLDTPELANMLERLGEDDHHHPREN